MFLIASLAMSLFSAPGRGFCGVRLPLWNGVEFSGSSAARRRCLKKFFNQWLPAAQPSPRCCTISMLAVLPFRTGMAALFHIDVFVFQLPAIKGLVQAIIMIALSTKMSCQRRWPLDGSLVKAVPIHVGARIQESRGIKSTANQLGHPTTIACLSLSSKLCAKRLER